MKKLMLGTFLTGIAIVLCLLTPLADAQGLSGNMFQNWNLLPGGARARGMGGAFLGVSNDATAAAWNPAGLIYNEGVSLSTNYSLCRVGLDFDRTLPGSSLEPRSTNTSLSNLSSASFQAPLTLQEHEFVLAVYYDRIQDVYAKGEFVLDSVDGDPLGRNLGTPFNANFGISGNLAMVGFGVGTVLKGPLTGGFTLNLATGNGVESHQMQLDSLRYSPGAYYQTVNWYDKSNLDYSGLNVKLGLLYKKERWTAAMIFVPRWILTQTLHYEAWRIRRHDQIPDFPWVMLPGPQGTKRKITIPYTVGLGGSYHLTDNILLAADYQFRPFKREGSFQYQNDPHEPDSSYETLPTDWYNLQQVRLGIEYMRETKYGMVPLRMGLRNEPMLIGNSSGALAIFDERSDPDKGELRSSYFLPLTQSGTTGDQIMGWTLAFGSGIYWSQVHLDLALEFTVGNSYTENNASLRMIRQCSSCPPTDPNVSKPDEDPWGRRATDDLGSYSREYTDNRMRLSLNFTGYF
jgi:opacity protein-like surface antigen